jgi:hypothetical protein
LKLTKTWRSISIDCLEEAGDDAAFVAKALGTITRAKEIRQLARNSVDGTQSLARRIGGAAGIENAAIPVKHLNTDDGYRYAPPILHNVPI